MEDLIDTQVTYLKPAFLETAIFDLLEERKDDYLYVPPGEPSSFCCCQKALSLCTNEIIHFIQWAIYAYGPDCLRSLML